MENVDSIKIDKFKSIKDFQLSSEQNLCFRLLT